MIIGDISIISCGIENTTLQAIIEFNPYNNISEIKINIILENENRNGSYNEIFDCFLDKNNENNITCLINKTYDQNNYKINYINYTANQNIQNAILKKNHILLFYKTSKVKTSIRTINACMKDDFKIQLYTSSTLENYKVFAIRNKTNDETGDETNNVIELNIIENKSDSQSVFSVNLTEKKKNLCGNECENNDINSNENIGYYVYVYDNCGEKKNTSMKIICKSQTKIDYEKSKSNESKFDFPKSVKGEYIKINKIVMLLFLFFI